jgi:peptide subunit release factor 1 (eRF1)
MGKANVYYYVACPVCNTEQKLTEAQYDKNAKFNCHKCPTRRPIYENLVKENSKIIS